MKTLSIKMLLIAFFAVMSVDAMAASISGTIVYSGTSTGTVFVAVYTDTTFSGKPAKYITMNAVGNYTIPDVADGTYYVVALMTKSIDSIQITDPWGGYLVSEKLAPVVISSGTNMTGINITLIDGTTEHHNPFYNGYAAPSQTLNLPSSTAAGTSPTLAYDGSFIYLYKHDTTNSASAKIYKINPSSGDVVDVMVLSLQSLPNRICWIDCLTFRQSALWATGGYGDPLGTGFIKGVFKVDIVTSTSSNQIRIDSTVGMSLENGLASDGTYLYIAVDSNHVRGIKKFNPDSSSSLPGNLSYHVDGWINSMSYGNGFLWAQIENVEKIDPVTGNVVASYSFPTANLYFNNMLWGYNETNNVIVGYNSGTTAVTHPGNQAPSSFVLSQNYPNPFNPTTVIRYQLPVSGSVTLKVYNLLGKEVATLVDGHRNAGNHQETFDASKFSSGVYFYQIKAGGFIQTKKMLLIK